jgi:hypothetical protein
MGRCDVKMDIVRRREVEHIYVLHTKDSSVIGLVTPVVTRGILAYGYVETHILITSWYMGEGRAEVIGQKNRDMS